jgi:hypothetical protein
MTKHIVCVALEVDDKYTAAAVAKEITHASECIGSELFDTLTGVHVARNPIKTYQVWNREHVACVADIPEGYGADTYEELLALEEVTGYSYSSFITTDDIDSVSGAVQNEWNGDLQYQLLESA